jgi:hypothetical protein
MNNGPNGGTNIQQRALEGERQRVLEELRAQPTSAQLDAFSDAVAERFRFVDAALAGIATSLPGQLDAVGSRQAQLQDQADRALNVAVSIAKRLDQLEARMGSLSTERGAVGLAVGKLGEKLDALGGKLEDRVLTLHQQLGQKLDAVEKAVATPDDFATIHKRITEILARFSRLDALEGPAAVVAVEHAPPSRAPMKTPFAKAKSAVLAILQKANGCWVAATAFAVICAELNKVYDARGNNNKRSHVTPTQLVRSLRDQGEVIEIGDEILANAGDAPADSFRWVKHDEGYRERMLAKKRKGTTAR